jgi:predicted signal transduction protein with EAL and GGDEF domain
LKGVAERLVSCVRDADTVARLGGDEFAVLAITDASSCDADMLAGRIIEKLGEPYELDGQKVSVGISVGIALAPGDGSDLDTLLKNADLALYRAKAAGGNAYRRFEPSMAAAMLARHGLDVDLRKALINNEFELYYQSILDLERNEISAFEALLRWNHPERGRIAPLDFIPLAEETGLIVPIGEWVLRHACSEAVHWPDHIRVAVNLSAVQFQPGNLVQTVISALTESGLAPRRLELEITESVLIEDSEAAVVALRELRHLGVRVAVDDFGSGYSSLTYLRDFPFDRIKIDRSFVGIDAGSRAILRAVAQLGTTLGLAITAEGVETGEQLNSVRAEGCTEVQGYFFSVPRPAAEIRPLFAAGNSEILAA